MQKETAVIGYEDSQRIEKIRVTKFFQLYTYLCLKCYLRVSFIDDYTKLILPFNSIFLRNHKFCITMPEHLNQDHTNHIFEIYAIDKDGNIILHTLRRYTQEQLMIRINTDIFLGFYHKRDRDA